MPGRISGVDAWLSTGAAMYWASVALRYMGEGCSLGLSAGVVGSSSPLSFLFLLGWIALSCLAVRRLGAARARRLVGASSAAATAVVGAAVALGFGRSPAAGAALLAADFFTVGAAMVLWGMAFASIERRLAAENVVVTVLVGTLIVVLAELLLQKSPQAPIMSVLSAASALVMAFGPVTMRNQSRGASRGGKATRRRDAPTVAGLLAQRLAFGATLGFLPSALLGYAPAALDVPLAAFSACVLVACAAVSLRAFSPVYAMLPSLVLIAAGALCLPSFADGVVGTAPALVAAVWFAWQSLTSVQLSEVKERLAMSELATTALDKAALAASLLAGSALAGATGPLDMPRLPVAAACLLTLASTFAVARLVGIRQQDAARDEAARLEARREEELYGRLAERLGLSAREREVMEMLARGYSGAFIAGQLGVSQSTAKSHIAHIYQKAGVHGKDEFLELIDS